MLRENGTVRLEDYTDNSYQALRVEAAASHDITSQVTKTVSVSRREIREMFVRFLRASPELHELPREEQIHEFNEARRAAHRPAIDPAILRDLLVPLDGKW